MSLDIPKSPIFTTRSSPTKQFLVARSLWTKWREARYTMPEAISAAMWSIWGRVNWPIRGTFISSRIRASGPWALYKNHTHYNTQYINIFQRWKWKVKSESDVTCGQVWWPILRICALHLTHPKCTHTAVNTHTHREHTPGAVGSHLCCSARGAVGGGHYIIIDI